MKDLGYSSTKVRKIPRGFSARQLEKGFVTDLFQII